MKELFLNPDGDGANFKKERETLAKQMEGMSREKLIAILDCHYNNHVMLKGIIKRRKKGKPD